jgi:hypothetical protein
MTNHQIASAMTPSEAVEFAKKHFLTVPEWAFQFLEDWAHNRDLSRWVELVRQMDTGMT